MLGKLQPEASAASTTHTGWLQCAISKGYLIALCPLLGGGAVYVAFRRPTLLMSVLADDLRIRGAMKLVRIFFDPARRILPVWVIYSLPDALWSLSMFVFFAVLWREYPVRRRQWVGAALVVAFMSEILQAMDLLPGTFSWIDLGTIAASYGAYTLVLRLYL